MPPRIATIGLLLAACLGGTCPDCAGAEKLEPVLGPAVSPFPRVGLNFGSDAAVEKIDDRAVVPAAAVVPSPGTGTLPPHNTAAPVAEKPAEKSAEAPGPPKEKAATPLTAEGERTPLAPPRSGPAPSSASPGGMGTAVRVVGSLALVLGIFFVAVWAMRRGQPASAALLPQEVLEVLGRASFPGRQQVHLIRLGAKLVLVSVTPAGMDTIAEVTDPLEVDRLAGLCRQNQPNSATAAFRQVFQQFMGKTPGEGSRG